MTKIIENPDGSYTVQIPRGDEVYLPSTGGLVSEATISSEDFKTFIKPVKGRGQTWGKAGFLNAQTLPAGLRDLVQYGDSELDLSHLNPDRPAALKALDDAATKLGDDGPPVLSAIGSQPAPTSNDPDHPTGATTAAAATLRVHQSPPGTRNPVSQADAQKAFETATANRENASALNAEGTETATPLTPAEVESGRSASGRNGDNAAEAAKRAKEADDAAARTARASR